MDKETVKEWLRDYAEMTERAIDRYIPERECLQKNVILAARHSLTAGGKRLRPALVMEFCRVCGGEPESALPVACAIEMMHTFSLIHDDLPCMDNDDMRRGKPSCHKAFGEANALLAGDALAILPAQVIAEAGIKGTITQSAALKIICDRENQIRSFIPEEYWSLEASLLPEGEKKPITAKLLDKGGEKFEISSGEQMNQVLAELKGKEFKVCDMKKGERTKKAPLPFTTSTLQ